MRLAVRVDASAAMSTGHFMRCLTLAEAVARRGPADVQFFSRSLPHDLEDMLAVEGGKELSRDREGALW